MKKTLFIAATAIVLAFFGSVSGADYVRMGKNGGCYNYLYFEVPFYIMHESPEPAVLTSGFNGFVVSSPDGYPRSELVDIVPQLVLPDGEFFYEIHENEGSAPDTFYVGFMSPTGIPIMTTEEPYFTLIIHTGWPGDLCFDTTWIPPDHEWSWSGPGESIVPAFLNQSHEEGSPHCIELIQFVCMTPSITAEPPDSGLVGYADCGDLSFELHNGEIQELWGCVPLDYRVLQGPGTIVTTSCTTAVYTCPPLEAGTYPVQVEVDYCCEYDYADFDVIFLDGEFPLGDCDCSGDVDIDDVVYLIAYIFSGGPEPQANPDCQGEVDIDDVVYLIYYIFSSGPEPCG